MASDYRHRSIFYRSILASRTPMLAALATAGALVASVLGATPASATVICGSPGLPPGCGSYRTPAEVHAAFANPDPAIIEAILKDASHDRFLNISAFAVPPRPYCIRVTPWL